MSKVFVDITDDSLDELVLKDLKETLKDHEQYIKMSKMVLKEDEELLEALEKVIKYYQESY